MNCGRPQDHRWHDEDRRRWNTLSNGCTYSSAQPEALMDAVLWPAIREAAEAAGVTWTQAHRAIYDYGQRQVQR